MARPKLRPFDGRHRIEHPTGIERCGPDLGAYRDPVHVQAWCQCTACYKRQKHLRHIDPHRYLHDYATSFELRKHVPLLDAIANVTAGALPKPGAA